MTGQSNDNAVIETAGLTKMYGTLKAVDKVSLRVMKGEIYGFLGLNGAGKTTTIRMLLGMIRPFSGDSFVCGTRISPGHPGPWGKIGYLVELPYSYPELTVKENLMAVSRLRGLTGNSHVQDVIELLHLDAYVNIKARNLSLGNNQRLGLAKALIHKPEVLILDEPSNGLDPAGIVEIRELLIDCAEKRGVTVFISSHNLNEIARIASRIGIIHQGALLQEIDTDKLERFLRKHLVIDARDRIGAAACLARNGHDVEYANDGMIRISTREVCENPEEINKLLVQAGCAPCHLELVQEDLETYFLRCIEEQP